MDLIQKAKLKDKIIDYLLRKVSKHASLQDLISYIDQSISEVSLKGIVEEMEKDNAVKCIKTKTSYDVRILEEGERIKESGGYLTELREELENKKLLNDDFEMQNQLMKLQIAQLEQQISDFPRVKLRSWFAIGVSIAAVISSIINFIFQ